MSLALADLRPAPGAPADFAAAQPWSYRVTFLNGRSVVTCQAGRMAALAAARDLARLTGSPVVSVSLSA